LFALILCSSAAAKALTPAQVNGSWAMPASEFKIWALDRQRLQIEFFGACENKGSTSPPCGAARGIALINGDIAIFKPDGVADCRITLTFAHSELIVTKAGTCDLGNYVNIDGSYKRVSTRKPIFVDR
jgi:hypothetical protein